MRSHRRSYVRLLFEKRAALVCACHISSVSVTFASFLAEMMYFALFVKTLQCKPVYLSLLQQNSIVVTAVLHAFLVVVRSVDKQVLAQ